MAIIMLNPIFVTYTLRILSSEIPCLGAFQGLNTSAPPVLETLEKLAQRDVQSMKDLMEVVCVWVTIKEPLRVYVGDAAFNQLEEMFMAGTLDFIFIPGQVNSYHNSGVPIMIILG